MTVYELREKTRTTEPYYFTRDTLQFFGERMSEMNVAKEIVAVTDYHGDVHECVELTKYSRKYPGGARHTYDYFDVHTWERVFPAND